MSDNQGGKTEPKKANPGKIALIGAGATALAVFNMATNGSEAPSQAVMILQYVCLAGGLLALVGGLIMMATART
jgi:succinate-acetate transporter protein